MEDKRARSKADHAEKSHRCDLPPGIVSQPTEEEFRISDREKMLLQELFDWSDRSKNTHWILGQPLGSNP